MVAVTGSALKRSASRQQGRTILLQTYQQPGSPRSSLQQPGPQQPGPQQQRHLHRQRGQPQSRLHRECISIGHFYGTGNLSGQLTSRGLSGGRSGSGVGLGSLGSGSRGRSGSSRSSSRSSSTSSGLFLLGLGLGRLLLAALLEGSLELALQVVKGAERCEKEVQSASPLSQAIAKPPAASRWVEAVAFFQPTRRRPLPSLDSDRSQQLERSEGQENKHRRSTYECQAYLRY